MELDTVRGAAQQILARNDTRAADRLVAALVLDYIEADRPSDARKLIYGLIVSKSPQS